MVDKVREIEKTNGLDQNVKNNIKDVIFRIKNSNFRIFYLKICLICGFYTEKGIINSEP